MGASRSAPGGHSVRSWRTLAGAAELWCDSWGGISTWPPIHRAASVGGKAIWCHMPSVYAPVGLALVCNKVVWSMFKGRFWKWFVVLFVEGRKCSASGKAAPSCWRVDRTDAAILTSGVVATPSSNWIGRRVWFLAVSAGLDCRACCSVTSGFNVNGFVWGHCKSARFVLRAWRKQPQHCDHFQDGSLPVEGGFCNPGFALQRPLFKWSERGYLKVL